MVPNLSTSTVPDTMDGTRLDNALSLFLPDAGIRIRKRLFDTHTVLVNGIPRSKGYTVSAGDQILLVEKTVSKAEDTQSEGSCSVRSGNSKKDLIEQLRIVHEDKHLAAIYKPGGMHSATIAGKNTLSLEKELGALFTKHSINDECQPILVNRLDCLTSGMVIAAKSPEAATMFRELENAGAIEKLYLLLVHGSVTAPLHVTNKLDMAKRKITKVLPETDPDPLRHTTFLPLLETTVPEDPSNNATLLMAAISKGARHQIRAHIASQGFPIVGDPMYNTPASQNTHEDSCTDHSKTMYLHHYQIELGSFSAMCSPSWDAWEHWKSSIPLK